MLRSSCKSCGEILTHDVDDVPPSGMVVKCPKCSTSVTVLPPDAAGLIGGDDILDLDDADMVELGDEVAPVAAKKGIPDLPAPVARKGIPDLPAPVAQKAIPDLPAPVAQKAIPDLPAPVAQKAIPDLPAPVAQKGIPDLPAPVSKGSISDLPAPVASKSLVDLPAPVASKGLADLPAPVESKGLVDLPAPAGAPDLPAPVAGLDLVAPASSANLPAPVDGSISISDLPAPVSSNSPADLPAPVGIGDRGDDPFAPPAEPKATMMGLGGGLDLGSPGENDPLGGGLDLGSHTSGDPLGGGLDLGSPGGNDPLGGGLDLGSPGGNDPLGGGLDLGSPGGNDPLGGGLDLGSPGGNDPLGGGLDLGSPGGNDPLGGGLDLGSPGGNDPLGGGLDLGGPGGNDPLGGGLDLGSPGGDDPLGGGLDLGSPGGNDPLGGGLDLGGPGGNDPLGGGLDLGGPGSDGGLDLGGPGLDLGGPGSDGGLDLGGPGLDSLDLESPSAGPGMGLDLPESKPVTSSSDVVTFGKPSGKAPPPKQSRLAQKVASNDDSLDLDDAPLEGPAVKARATVEQAAANQAAAHKTTPSKASTKAGKRQKIGAAALGVVVLGAGGFFGLQYMQDKSEKGAVVGQKGDSAETQLASDKAGHWQKAIVAAKEMQKIDAKNIEAAAILAEAHYAAALDTGTGVEAHQKQGAAAIRTMRKLNGTSPHVALAQGLHALHNAQHEDAIKTLTKAAAQNKKNPNAGLYLGWALANQRHYARAVAAFDKALALTPKRIAALYGKATALLEAGKHKEASETYLQISAIDKDHLGALLGIARLADVGDFGGRENRFLEILGRADIDKQNPRIVSKATALAGDEARKAGRLAVASERYTSALKLDPSNLDAVVGQAAVSIAKNNIEDAAQKLDRVLALAPAHIEATILLIEVAMMQKNTDKAANSLANLMGREPKIEYKPTLAKMELLRGRLLSADASASADAEAAYRQAIELSDDGGVAASLELAALLTKLERADEGNAVLEPLREKAKDDAGLSVSLGVAYMASKMPTEAIALFRNALEQKPTDTEARFQLGRALATTEQTDEAIKELQQAYDGSAKREDIGLELAEIYRRLGRNEEAVALFTSVLEGPAPSRNAKAQAGAYFARMGEYDRADKIGQELLAADPKDPAGMFLTGVKLYQDGDHAKAQGLFSEASKIDPLPQYFEALGRANEKLQSFTKGMRAFERAIQDDPSYLEPRLGLARIRMARREFALALEVLEDATKVEPEKAIIYYMIGTCHLELRDVSTAVGSFNQAISLEPEFAPSYYGLGLAYDANAKQKDAAVAYDKATKLATDSDEEWVGEAYRKLGYAIRQSGGSRKAQYEAWVNYIDRVKIESDASKEVEKLLIPLRNKYR